MHLNDSNHNTTHGAITMTATLHTAQGPLWQYPHGTTTVKATAGLHVLGVPKH